MTTDKHQTTYAECALPGSRVPRPLVFVIAAMLVLAAGILLYSWGRPEPSWNGRRLGSWLYELRPYSQLSGPTQDQAEAAIRAAGRSEEHTSELQSRLHLVCRLLLEKKKNYYI